MTTTEPETIASAEHTLGLDVLVQAIDTEQDWPAYAACRGHRFLHPNAWTPSDANAYRTTECRRAREVCWYECPVRPQCLEAGKNEPIGLWGGYTPQQRRGREQN